MRVKSAEFIGGSFNITDGFRVPEDFKLKLGSKTCIKIAGDRPGDDPVSSLTVIPVGGVPAGFMLNIETTKNDEFACKYTMFVVKHPLGFVIHEDSTTRGIALFSDDSRTFLTQGDELSLLIVANVTASILQVTYLEQKFNLKQQGDSLNLLSV